MKKKETLLAILLIVIAVTCRFIPHIPNFVPITAIALFSGRYFKRAYAFFIPLGVMFVSDIFLGFSDVTFYVYFSLFVTALIGYLLQKQFNYKRLALTALGSSILFFLITNFGVWQAGWYGHTLNGLVTCYEMAIPFFRNSLFGDIFYTAVIFGSFELATRLNYFKKTEKSFNS